MKFLYCDLESHVHITLETNLQKLQSSRFFFLAFVSTGIAMTVANIFGKSVATLFTNIIFVPIPGAAVVLSILFAKRNGITGNHGKAWISFTIFIIFWFIAEQVWFVEEVFYHENPFPSTADYFYLAGYPFYFLFSILYLKPFKDAIDKKVLVISVLISISLFVPSLYMTMENNSDESQYAIILGAIYPVADSIVLVPAIIGSILFFRGKVNFMWSLLLMGMIFEVVADTGFQYFSLDDSMYTGHPVDMLFLWAYICFAFGIYDQMKLFQKNHDNKSFSGTDLSDLR